jgi:hypothetical protein
MRTNVLFSDDPLAAIERQKKRDAQQKEHWLGKQGFAEEDTTEEASTSGYGTPFRQWAAQLYAERDKVQCVDELRQEREALGVEIGNLQNKINRADAWEHIGYGIGCGVGIFVLAVGTALLATPMPDLGLGLTVAGGVTAMSGAGIAMAASSWSEELSLEKSDRRSQEIDLRFRIARVARPAALVHQAVYLSLKDAKEQTAATHPLAFSADQRPSGWRAAAVDILCARLMDKVEKMASALPVELLSRKNRDDVAEIMNAHGLVLPAPLPAGASAEEIGKNAARRVRVLRRAERLLAKMP